ncbi:MAG: hypothetical protein JSV80_00815 [Acidobacteriota bacterium]|nr:MAG: hypothetical protein JSV80_00815 [Acidobacteriota bacterium]
MFQESELVNLGIALTTLPIVIVYFRRRRLPDLRWLWVGYGLVIAALILTVLEGGLWPPMLQTLEHVALALAGLSFAAGVIILARGSLRPNGTSHWK